MLCVGCWFEKVRSTAAATAPQRAAWPFGWLRRLRRGCTCVQVNRRGSVLQESNPLSFGFQPITWWSRRCADVQNRVRRCRAAADGNPAERK